MLGDGVDGDVFWRGEFIVLYLAIDEIRDFFLFVRLELGDDGVNVGAGFREHLAKLLHAASFLAEAHQEISELFLRFRTTGGVTFCIALFFTSLEPSLERRA